MQCKGKNENCNIYVINYEEKKWSKADKFSYFSKEHNIGHPSLSSDGKKMYFVSDMPGGKGGRDIWYIKKEGAEWGEPVNMEEINTNGDEMFPYIYADTLLFFSSDGHLGMGNLDVFASEIIMDKAQKPVNLETPFNSGADDFGIILRENHKGGFYCSNRPGGKGNDDVYSFKKFPFTQVASGLVYKLKTDEPVAGIIIFYETDNGEKDSTISGSDGNYHFFPKPNKRYSIKVSNNKYLSDIKTLDVGRLMKNKEYNKGNGYDLDFGLIEKLPANITISGRVIEEILGYGIPNEKVYIYAENDEFNTYALTDKDGNYSINHLKPKTKYTVKVSKEGYFSVSKDLKTEDTELDKTYNRKTGYDMDFQLKPIVIQDKEYMINNIYWVFDKAELVDSSMGELNIIARMLKETPVAVEIRSHCDERGSIEYNDELSDRRAKVIAEYLINSGISSTRISSKGYGKSKPLVRNASSEEEHLLNRRTTFTVLKMLNIEEMADDVKKTDDGQSIYNLNNVNDDCVEYRIQILAKQERLNSFSFFNLIKENVPEVNFTYEKSTDGIYRYFTGSFNSYQEAKVYLDEIKATGYSDCFIATFNKGKRVFFN